MSTRVEGGPVTWSMDRDDEGHRTYKVTYLVVSDTHLDGPAAALTTPGLPAVGSWWIVDNDYDLWAWCRPNARVTPLVTGGRPNKHWHVEFTFSTKPSQHDRGLDAPGSPGSNPSGVEDPLLEPQKVSGSFVKYTQEALQDRYGVDILTSSHEMIRGPQNEWDDSRPTVRIEQNVPVLQLDVLAQFANRVNDATLWGLPARCWKLSEVSWERLFHGQYQVYYKRTFQFDAKYDTWDRYILDEGTKALNGQWNRTTGEWDVKPMDPLGVVAADYTNPSHFVRFTDKNGNPCRVILNGYGRPISGDTGTSSLDTPGRRYTQVYDEANFLLLGIPVTF